MSVNLIKRILSSIILIIILFFFLNSNKIIFFLVLSCIFFIACYELKKIILKTNLLIAGCLFLLFSFYCFFKFRFLDNNNSYLYFLLIICIGSDVGGYIIGKIFGGPKLTKISPNKTYSGMLGAFIFSLIFSSIYLYISKNIYFSFTIYNFEMYALILICSGISQLGDIFISYLKRKSNVKDSGKLIPGHGGILDRIDGIIFVFPFIYIFYQLNF